MDIRIKTILASAVPILALLTGLYFALQSLSVAMGSTIYMPDTLRALPDTIWSLTWWTISVGVTIAIVRVAFAFSRFTEMRGRHEYPNAYRDGDSTNRLLSVPSRPNLGNAQHERTEQLADFAARRAQRRVNIGNIPVTTARRASDAQFESTHESLYSLDGRNKL